MTAHKQNPANPPATIRTSQSSTEPCSSTTSATSKNSPTKHSPTNSEPCAPPSTPKNGKTPPPTSSPPPGKPAKPMTHSTHPASANTPTAAYASAQSTGTGNATKTPAHPNHPPHSHSTNYSTQTPNWETLSPRARMILTTIATPISNGYSETELANTLGVPKSQITHWLTDLRHELESR